MIHPRSGSATPSNLSRGKRDSREKMNQFWAWSEITKKILSKIWPKENSFWGRAIRHEKRFVFVANKIKKPLFFYSLPCQSESWTTWMSCLCRIECLLFLYHVWFFFDETVKTLALWYRQVLSSQNKYVETWVCVYLFSHFRVWHECLAGVKPSGSLCSHSICIFRFENVSSL